MGSHETEPTTASPAEQEQTQALPESQTPPARQDPDSAYKVDVAPQGDAHDFATTLPHCGACRVGLLYPISYDPEATHEANQGLATQHDQFAPSGGSLVVRCFNCGNQQSQPLGAGGES